MNGCGIGGCLFLACCCMSAAAVEVDGIAAKVGAEAILKSDVFGEMRQLGADESQYGETLNRVIERKLMLKAAKESKMTMQEWVVENRVREIVHRSFGGDRNRLMEMLAKQKVSYTEWYAKLRDDLIVGAMRWQVVDKNVTASPSEMRDEYANHPERYEADSKVTVAMIVLKPEDAPKRSEIDAMIATEAFGDIARRYSSDSHASEGGVWKDISPAETFSQEICEEIGRMPKGTISHWIEIDGWSYLLRKIDESAGRKMTFEEAFEAIDRNVREQKAKTMYEAWIARLKAETYVKIY